ncbi:tetratricopeptide repeat-containing sensor histidine kinase [Niastella vici]|nr:histidine kinase [Niastella vici]
MYRLLLLAFIFACCKQPKNDHNHSLENVDSLITVLKKRVNPYFHNREPEKAGVVLDSLRGTVEEIDDYRLTGAWLRCKTVEKTMSKSFDSATYYGKKALKLALEKDTSNREIIAAQIQFADVLKEQNFNDSALKYARKAYYMAKKVDTLGLPLICLRLYEIYSRIGDLSMQRFYLFEGLKYSKQPTHKTVFANNISRYYTETGQNDSAILFFKAMENDTSFSSPYFDAVKFENLGILLTNKKKYKEGLYYQLKAFAINKEIGEMDALSYFNLAATYQHLQGYDKAIYYLDTALKLAIPVRDWQLIKRIWHAKALNLKLQSKKDDAYTSLDSAYTYYGIEVDSSILLRERELEKQYKVKAKDEEIKSLAFANKVSNRINRQQRIIIFALITSGLLAGIIAYLMWRRRKLQMQVREIELRQQLLRTRMEPHFLFNLLSVLQGFIRDRLYEKSSQYLIQFSQLLRLSLENAGYNYASLKDEVSALDSFLRLQEMNLENFEYRIEVLGELVDYDISIPPMLIQPFVENAILHGFPSGYKGYISVRIICETKALRVTIDDNGVGLKDITTNKAKRSMATIITQERLNILGKRFHRPAKLRIIDKKTEKLGQGLTVELIIPFEKKRKNKVQTQTAA